MEKPCQTPSKARREDTAFGRHDVRTSHRGVRTTSVSSVYIVALHAPVLVTTGRCRLHAEAVRHWTQVYKISCVHCFSTHFPKHIQAHPTQKQPASTTFLTRACQTSSKNMASPLFLARWTSSLRINRLKPHPSLSQSMKSICQTALSQLASRHTPNRIYQGRRTITP